jgi:hypothetical protein
MSIADHVSRAMLSRHSHVRMEAKRRALDEIAARQRVADDKRHEAAERQQQDVCDFWHSRRASSGASSGRGNLTVCKR